MPTVREDRPLGLAAAIAHGAENVTAAEALPADGHETEAPRCPLCRQPSHGKRGCGRRALGAATLKVCMICHQPGSTLRRYRDVYFHAECARRAKGKA